MHEEQCWECQHSINGGPGGTHVVLGQDLQEEARKSGDSERER